MRIFIYNCCRLHFSNCKSPRKLFRHDEHLNSLSHRQDNSVPIIPIIFLCHGLLQENCICYLGTLLTNSVWKSSHSLRVILIEFWIYLIVSHRMTASDTQWKHSIGICCHRLICRKCIKQCCCILNDLMIYTSVVSVDLVWKRVFW